MKKYKFCHLLFILEKCLSKLNKKSSRMIEKIMYSKIQRELNPYFEQAENNINVNNQKNSDIVWILWWQGLSNAPKIVKACINSVIENYDGRVIVITKDNLDKYTNIPQYIYDKLNSGLITKTHFSDIVRFNLLRNHGGLWIDSTIFCSKKFYATSFDEFYTSKGLEDSYPYFMKGKWTGFLIGGQKNDLTFQFMDEFFKIYWQKNDYLINYFLIDYALKYSYENNIGSLSKYADNKAMNNNPRLFELVNYLNCKFEKSVYNDLIKDTTFFKLTYKKKFDENKDTFFDNLLKNNNLR